RSDGVGAIPLHGYGLNATITSPAPSPARTGCSRTTTSSVGTSCFFMLTGSPFTSSFWFDSLPFQSPSVLALW
ncbi:unnamed protein product, partial [Musa acuminata subsp. burmannicoides]